MSVWIIPTALAVALSLWLNGYVLVHRPLRPLAPALYAALFSGLLWTVGDLFSEVVTDPAANWAGLTVLYTGVIFIPAAWWVLALRFSDAHELGLRFTRRWWVYLPVAVSSALWLAFLTNPWHEGFLTPHPGEASTYHFIWWLHSAEGYSVNLATASIYGFLSYRAGTGVVRRRLLILLFATLATASASAVHVLAPVELPFDPTSIGIAVTSLLLIYGIYGSRLFALGPVALTEVLRQQPVGILVVGATGDLLYANGPAIGMLGARVLPVDARPFVRLAQVLHPLDATEAVVDARALRASLTDREQPADGHLFRFGESGSGWLRIRVAAILTGRGSLRAWSLSLEDQTALYAAAEAIRAGEAALLRAQKLESLGVMAGGIAHDFNNLLQGVLGNTDLALESAEPGSTQQELLREIELCALRASELVHQLLLYAGSVQIEKRETEISELVNGARDLASRSFSEEIKLEIELDPVLPTVIVDPPQLRQAIVSVLLNAAEAMRSESGTIRVVAGVETLGLEDVNELEIEGELLAGRYLRIDVSDQGVGMDEETRERIFEPFYSTKFPGRGLGLAAVAGILRSHAGGVAVRTTPGIGTCVSLYLPATGGIEPGHA